VHRQRVAGRETHPADVLDLQGAELIGDGDVETDEHDGAVKASRRASVQRLAADGQEQRVPVLVAPELDDADGTEHGIGEQPPCKREEELVDRRDLHLGAVVVENAVGDLVEPPVVHGQEGVDEAQIWAVGDDLVPPMWLPARTVRAVRAYRWARRQRSTRNH
jgi:hypothetical protein